MVYSDDEKNEGKDVHVGLLLGLVAERGTLAVKRLQQEVDDLQVQVHVQVQLS